MNDPVPINEMDKDGFLKYKPSDAQGRKIRELYTLIVRLRKKYMKGWQL